MIRARWFLSSVLFAAADVCFGLERRMTNLAWWMVEAAATLKKQAKVMGYEE